MEKLKQSFRKSFRRKKSQNLTLSNVKQKQNCVETIGNIHNGKSYCQSDEATVRSAACSFQVKYLGACEVFDSRGMHVCESALQQLRLKKRATKAILYVTGDGLRLVDQQENRGLILDQTIEKVSFCAPDRSDDKSFAYICRDGTSKRWMCHGFLSIQDNVNGERLSHAVGCAFTICLEKKQLRDIEVKDKKDTQVKAITDNNFERIFESTPSHNQNGLQRNILEYASFRRQLSLVERKLDPQKAIIHNNPLKNLTNTSKFEANQIPIVNNHFNNTNNFSTNFNNVKNSDLQNDINSTTIKPRPVSNPSLFKRQGSIKAPISSMNTTIFKRFNSLRVDLPLKNSFIPISAVNNEPIYEGTETCSTELINNDLSEEKPELLKNTNSFALTSNDFFSNNKDLDFETNKTLSTNNCFNNCDFDKNSKKADEWLSEVLASSCAKFSQNSLAISTVTSFQSNYNQHNSMQNNLSKTHSFDASFNKSRFVSKSPNQMLRNHVLPYSQSVNFQPTNYFASDSKNNSQFLSPTTKNEENNRIPSPNYVRHGSLNGRANLTKNNQTNIKFTENPKKNSAVRLSIEYQLLEETDAPLQSPSKVHLGNEADLDKKPLIEITNSTQNNIYNFNNTTLLTNEKNLHDTTIFGNKGNNTLTQVCSRTTPNTVLMIGKDPFDVQWSTEVLKNSARRKDSIEKSIKSFLLSSDTFLPQLNTQQTLTKPIFDSTDTSYSVTSNLNVFLPVTLANNTNPFYTN